MIPFPPQIIAENVWQSMDSSLGALSTCGLAMFILVFIAAYVIDKKLLHLVENAKAAVLWLQKISEQLREKPKSPEESHTKDTKVAEADPPPREATARQGEPYKL